MGDLQNKSWARVEGVAVGWKAVAARVPRKRQAMGAHLTFHWMFSIAMRGDHSRVFSRRIFSAWRPILVFRNGPLNTAMPMVSDWIMGSGPQKDGHPWQQAAGELDYWIGHLSPPNGLVVDPFCGSGTTAVVCRHLSRRFIGTESNAAVASKARKRLAEMEAGGA